MTDNRKVGFIGLGNQGAPIAMRILGAGWPLRVWARRPESLAPFVEAGAVAHATPRDLAADCDIVQLCVRTDDDIRDVALRADGVLAGMAPGTILVLHSTLDPQTVVEIGEAAGKIGVRVLDAPVSGGPKGASAGTMTVLVGGDAEALEEVRPVLETFAATIPLLGPLGSGQLLKLLNNNLCYASVAMSIAALELARKLGMDPKVSETIMRVSSGASHGLDLVAESASLEKMCSPTSNVRKDVGHLVNVLAARGLDGGPLTAVSTTTADRVKAYAASLAG